MGEEGSTVSPQPADDSQRCDNQRDQQERSVAFLKIVQRSSHGFLFWNGTHDGGENGMGRAENVLVRSPGEGKVLEHVRLSSSDW